MLMMLCFVKVNVFFCSLGFVSVAVSFSERGKSEELISYSIQV